MISLDLKDTYLQVPNPSRRPQVPEVYGIRQTLPVSGSFFWSLHGSAGFHQRYGSSLDCSPLARYLDPLVPGRLASPSSVLGAGFPGSGDSSLSLSRAGFSEGSLSRNDDGLYLFKGFSFPAESFCQSGKNSCPPGGSLCPPGGFC